MLERHGIFIMTIREILADIKSDRKKKVVLDTDTFNEIDDQYALAYCYVCDKMDLVAVHAAPYFNDKSTSYEDGMLKSYNEIKKVLSLIDPDYTTPVFEGSRTTIEVSGGIVDSPAARNLIEVVKNSDEIVYVLAIGAITNVVSAIAMDPSIKDNMCVVWLGGNQLDSNNLGEFNLVQDFTAGQMLLNSGVPLFLCPAWFVTCVLTTDYENVCTLKGHNKVLWAAMIGSLLLTTLVLEVPFIANAFGFTMIGWDEYAIAIALAIIVIPVVEIVKLIQRKTAKR